MSRIGRLPITVPAGVEVKIDGQQVEVKGPKGTLSRTFNPEIGIELKDGVLQCSRPDDEPETRSLHGLTRALLNNMIVGVTTGFSRQLDLVGVGYRASMNGRNLVLNVGLSHPCEMDPGEDLTVETPAPNKIIISGIDKEKVGAFAADVRAVRPPEPYKGKGIKYAEEYIRRKAGKAGIKK